MVLSTWIPAIHVGDVSWLQPSLAMVLLGMWKVNGRYIICLCYSHSAFQINEIKSNKEMGSMWYLSCSPQGRNITSHLLTNTFIHGPH